MTEKMIEMLVAGMTPDTPERNRLVFREALRALARLASSEQYAGHSEKSAERKLVELNRRRFCYPN